MCLTHVRLAVYLLAPVRLSLVCLFKTEYMYMQILIYMLVCLSSIYLCTCMCVFSIYMCVSCLRECRISGFMYTQSVCLSVCLSVCPFICM